MTNTIVPASPDDGDTGKYDLNEFVRRLSDEPTVVPNCKVCATKHRKEVEAMAERGSTSVSIHRWLKDQLEKEGAETISYGSVNNHINFHFKTKQTESDLKVYVNQLAGWSKISKSDDQLLNRYIDALDMEVTFLLSKNAIGDVNERRKNNEIILKMMAQIAALKESLKTLRAELRPVEIMVKTLDRIIEFKIASVDAKTKEILRDVIDQLKLEVKDVLVDGFLEEK